MIKKERFVDSGSLPVGDFYIVRSLPGNQDFQIPGRFLEIVRSLPNQDFQVPGRFLDITTCMVFCHICNNK